VEQVTPWPDAISTGGAATPTGVPFVGELAATPTLCQTTLTADYASGPANDRTIKAGTWSLGFDRNRDGQPDNCAVAEPLPATTTTTSFTATTTPVIGATPGPGAARLPKTGSNANSLALVGIGALLAGTTLVAAKRLRPPKKYRA
jgi:LPXTG-motif cell wall-anchored protein